MVESVGLITDERSSVRERIEKTINNNGYDTTNSLIIDKATDEWWNHNNSDCYSDFEVIGFDIIWTFDDLDQAIPAQVYIEGLTLDIEDLD